MCCACAALLAFLIDANSRIHIGLTLRTVKTMDLETMINHFLLDEEQERAQSSGITDFFLKQLQQKADAVPVQRRASLMESSSFRSRGSSSRQSSSSMTGAEDAADTDGTEKDKIIDSLLDKGRKMIRQGVFALPKLAWNATEGHPDEKRVLQMIGFLLDAYHKEAWWWELFEMWRKFMLAGAIILIPTEGGKQIAFALLISTICLYTSLRTSPYIVENLLKLHIMSLTAQCITLFYALLLEIQDLSSVAEVCEDGKTCNQQNISDYIMESLLSLLQVSVFVLPVVLLLRDRGVFDAVGMAFKRGVEEVRKGAGVCTGHTAVETKKVRWPSSVTDDDSASSAPLRSRKKGLNQAPETIYSARRQTVRAQTAGVEGGDSRTTARGVGVRIRGVEDTNGNAFPPMSQQAHLHDTVSEDKHTASDEIQASSASPSDGTVLLKQFSRLNRDKAVALSRAESAQAGLFPSLRIPSSASKGQRGGGGGGVGGCGGAGAAAAAANLKWNECEAISEEQEPEFRRMLTQSQPHRSLPTLSLPHSYQSPEASGDNATTSLDASLCDHYSPLTVLASQRIALKDGLVRDRLEPLIVDLSARFRPSVRRSNLVGRMDLVSPSRVSSRQVLKPACSRASESEGNANGDAVGVAHHFTQFSLRSALDEISEEGDSRKVHKQVGDDKKPHQDADQHSNLIAIVSPSAAVQASADFSSATITAHFTQFSLRSALDEISEEGDSRKVHKQVGDDKKPHQDADQHSNLIAIVSPSAAVQASADFSSATITGDDGELIDFLTAKGFGKIAHEFSEKMGMVLVEHFMNLTAEDLNDDPELGFLKDWQKRMLIAIIVDKRGVGERETESPRG